MKKMRVAVLAYTFYESDNRVRRYSETLIKQGHQVDVISLRDKNQSSFGILKGVNVFRIQKRVVNENKKIVYLLKILLFLFNSFVVLTIKNIKKKYKLVHVHSVPDFEVFAAIIPKLTGAKIILDIHDIVPEFYASKFNSTDNSILFKSLILLEKCSIRFADHVIIANHIWKKTLLLRSVKEEKCTVVLNYPDPDIFCKRNRVKKSDKFILLYPGTLNWHQGIDIAIKALAKIKDKIPEAEFHIYGTGRQKDNLIKLIAELNCKNRIIFKAPLPLDLIPDVIANADVGIVPKRKNSFGNEAFSTKIFEFMTQGIPVIVSDTKIDKYYFDDSLVLFFKSDNEDDLAKCILQLKKNQELKERLVNNSYLFIEKNSWKVKQNEYLSLVNSLVNQ